MPRLISPGTPGLIIPKTAPAFEHAFRVFRQMMVIFQLHIAVMGPPVMFLNRPYRVNKGHSKHSLRNHTNLSFSSLTRQFQLCGKEVEAECGSSAASKRCYSQIPEASPSWRQSSPLSSEGPYACWEDVVTRNVRICFQQFVCIWQYLQLHALKAARL